MNILRVLKYITLILLVVILIVSYSQVDASSDLSLAIGKGKRNTVTFEFKIIQTSSKLVKGDVFAENPGLWTVEGTIDCLSVNGHTAVFGGINEVTNNPFTIMVSDNPDGIIFGTGSNCDTTGFGVPIPIEEGNIVVTDPN